MQNKKGKITPYTGKLNMNVWKMFQMAYIIVKRKESPTYGIVESSINISEIN
jgi:hypothetical protein